MRKFTQLQLEVHGELILKWINDSNLEIQYLFNDLTWETTEDPSFWVETEYRIKPKLLYVNDAGEEFTEEDLKSNILVYWFGKSNYSICKGRFKELNKPNYKSSNSTSEIYKSRLSAAKAVVKYLEKQEE